jgi:hypothetical protein
MLCGSVSSPCCDCDIQRLTVKNQLAELVIIMFSDAHARNETYVGATTVTDRVFRVARHQQSPSWSIFSMLLIEPKCSSPYSHHSSFVPWLSVKRTQSAIFQFTTRSVLILYSNVRLSSSNGLFPVQFYTKICKHFWLILCPLCDSNM